MNSVVVDLLDKLCLDVKTICNDYITVFLVDNTLKPDDIDNNCMKIHEVDCIYKDTYEIYREDIELLPKINKMLENKEKFYLDGKEVLINKPEHLKKIKEKRIIIASTLALKEIHEQIQSSGNIPLITFPI